VLESFPKGKATIICGEGDSGEGPLPHGVYEEEGFPYLRRSSTGFGCEKSSST